MPNRRQLPPALALALRLHAAALPHACAHPDLHCFRLLQSGGRTRVERHPSIVADGQQEAAAPVRRCLRAVTTAPLSPPSPAQPCRGQPVMQRPRYPVHRAALKPRLARLPSQEPGLQLACGEHWQLCLRGAGCPVRSLAPPACHLPPCLRFEAPPCSCCAAKPPPPPRPPPPPPPTHIPTPCLLNAERHVPARLAASCRATSSAARFRLTSSLRTGRACIQWSSRPSATSCRVRSRTSRA